VCPVAGHVAAGDTLARSGNCHTLPASVCVDLLVLLLGEGAVQLDQLHLDMLLLLLLLLLTALHPCQPTAVLHCCALAILNSQLPGPTLSPRSVHQ
jgi:hypothetical protein